MLVHKDSANREHFLGAGEVVPSHQCTSCTALWRYWPGSYGARGSWNLRSNFSCPDCERGDNTIEPLRMEKRLALIRHKRKSYPLKVENVGGDTYVLMSRGHHDVHTFMKKVRLSYQWPLGMPTHEWRRTVPAPESSMRSVLYVPAKPHSRGAFPCTCVVEAYEEDSYEEKVKAQIQHGPW